MAENVKMDDYEINMELQGLMGRVIHDNWNFHILERLNIQCISRNKPKTGSGGKVVYADCTKISDKIKAVTDCDFIITFYKDGLICPPEIQYRIMFHELCHIGYEPDTGRRFIKPHDLEDFRAVIDKWGSSWLIEERGEEE